jgi:hypothetical protein
VNDVLLLFVSEQWIDDDSMLLEWYPLGLDTLVTEMPKPAWDFIDCYGVRHRTVDYPDPSALKLVESLIPDDYAEGYPRDLLALSTCVYRGMKIGGAPSWEHPEEPMDNPEDFLCALGCVYTPWDVAYPWVNHPDPIRFDDAIRHHRHLDIADTFHCNFTMDNHGKIHSFMEYS